MASSRDASKPYTGSWPARKTIHPHGLLRSEPNIAMRPTTCLFAITSYSARFAVGCSSRSVTQAIVACKFKAWAFSAASITSDVLPGRAFGLISLIALRSVSLMRVCQPGPVARK
jgi:hypothetical protein